MKKVKAPHFPVAVGGMYKPLKTFSSPVSFAGFLIMFTFNDNAIDNQIQKVRGEQV